MGENLLAGTRQFKLLPPGPGEADYVAASLDWQQIAACQSTDPELFFPVSSTGKSLEQASEAKAVCACCLVRRQCLAYALRTRQAHGIWGGMTEEERARRISRRQAGRQVMNSPVTA